MTWKLNQETNFKNSTIYYFETSSLIEGNKHDYYNFDLSLYLISFSYEFKTLRNDGKGRKTRMKEKVLK